MPLIEYWLTGHEDKVKNAIELIKYYEPPEGYYVAFSGGKDSIVIKDLIIKSGVKYDIHYNNTTIDPPELTAYIRKHHPDVQQHFPPKSYFKMISEKGFPMRQIRWCCQYLKEYGGENRVVITGIRAEESYKRNKRKQFEHCSDSKYKYRKQYLHPIFFWKEIDVWEYIKKFNLPYCKLYNEGFNRLGCIGCPMTYVKRRIEALQRYPRIDRAYRNAFNKLYEKRKREGREAINRWKNGEEMYHWWITNEEPNEIPPLFA